MTDFDKRDKQTEDAIKETIVKQNDVIDHAMFFQQSLLTKPEKHRFVVVGTLEEIHLVVDFMIKNRLGFYSDPRFAPTKEEMEDTLADNLLDQGLGDKGMITPDGTFICLKCKENKSEFKLEKAQLEDIKKHMLSHREKNGENSGFKDL